MANVVDLLRKLTAHKNSAEQIGNQAEAEAFASTIATLLSKYKLSMSDVEFQTQQKENPFTQQSVKKSGGSAPVWMMRLSGAIASSMFCKRLYIAGQNGVMFIGRKQDVEACTMMYNYLIDVANKMRSKELRAVKKQQKNGAYFHPEITAHNWRIWRLSFLKGFADGIAARLEQQKVANFALTTNALVLKDAALLKEYIDATMRIGKGYGRKTRATDGGAYAKGKEHGTMTSLGQKLQLGSGK